VFELVGAFALLLSTVGLYGMLAYAGAQRVREFAMRIALGAQGRDVIRLVLRDALVLVLGGTAAGAFVAMVSAQVIKRLLYSVDPMDAVALVSAEGILIAVSLLAALGPAMRAARADPVNLLRST
jgi:putative ABC transport system permease protein